MNENFENMLEELEREFPDSYNKELYLVIHNEVCDDYYVDDEFQEELFSNLFINYKTSAIEISRDFKNNLFDEDKNKKCKTKFRIDDPNFIGYIPKIEMKI